MRTLDHPVTFVWRTLTLSLLVVLAVQLSSAQDADANQDLERELAEIHSQMDGIHDQLNELDRQVIEAAVAKTIVHSGTSNSTMKIVGRVHADYWGFPESSPGIDALEGGPDGPQTRIGFRRVRFGVRGELPANMEYRIEAEFTGGNATEFRDVWLGWNELPVLDTLLIGNQKRPYGLDQLNSSRYNVFLERPFIIEAINQDARRLGIASYGLSDDQRWNWRYGVYNQRLIQDEGHYVSDNLQLECAARLANTFWYDEASDGRRYGHWAISGTTAYPDGRNSTDNGSIGPDANEAQFRTRPEARTATRWLDTGKIAGADNYQMLGVEGLLNFGSMQLVGEYQNLWLNRIDGYGPDPLRFHGGYTYLSYFLTGEHIPWSRKSGTLGRVKPFEDFFLVKRCDGCVDRGWGAWQVALRWSYADFNDNDIFGGIGESLTVGLNWHWTSNARMQLNWIHGTVDDNAITRGMPLSGSYDIIGTRFMVDF